MIYNSGPVLQTLMVPIGYPGPVEEESFHFNFYTSPALVSVIIYLVIGFVYIRYYNEYVVLENEARDISELNQANSRYSISSASTNGACNHRINRY
jgi:hypothetical protein